MKNNGEQRMTKRFRSYPLKFLVGAVLFFICSNAYPQETRKFDSEAKKLEFIRQMLIKEKYFSESELNAPHCNQMMIDLLANKNFKAIEPVVRADSVDDPRMAKWKQCEDYGLGGVNIFHSLDSLGAPPYRYYRVELDGNKENGPEDMIYHNQTSEPGKLGATGYTWVDLNNCQIKDGFPITGALARVPSRYYPNRVFLNTLVYYKGDLWAVEFVEGSGFSLMRWIDRKRMETCRWPLP